MSLCESEMMLLAGQFDLEAQYARENDPERPELVRLARVWDGRHRRMMDRVFFNLGDPMATSRTRGGRSDRKQQHA